MSEIRFIPQIKIFIFSAYTQNSVNEFILECCMSGNTPEIETNSEYIVVKYLKKIDLEPLRKKKDTIDSVPEFSSDETSTE